MTKKILIVDDQFTIRYLVEHHLKKQGLATIMAKDGPSALTAVRTEKPDLIVLDIMMTGMDGFEVLQRLKDDPDLARIPVIFLTTLSSKEDKLRAFNLGAEDYLTKPFQADEFIAHVMAALRATGQLSAENKDVPPHNGHVTALYSPKGGVGTTTLTIQLGETLALREGSQVAIIDLALPLGGIAPILKLYTTRHIIDLLKTAQEEYSLERINHFAQNHRSNLKVIPAPGFYTDNQTMPEPNKLVPVLDMLAHAGYQVLLDVGTALTPLTLRALMRADKTFVITSGQPEANLQVDTFLSAASQLGLTPHRLMPVINELYGDSVETTFARVPVAHIPHTSKASRTRLWVAEQGLQKLAAVVLA
ncbi:MAG: response regulator [Anaerolineae bacterium]|jgi:CheY-like chemotaxis protein